MRHHAMDTSANSLPVDQRELPLPRHCRAQRRGQPGLIVQLAQQHRPAMPGQALALASHFILLSPPVSSMSEERSLPEKHV